MKPDDAILEKIRKLLRLGQSANAHEAGLALEHAFRLAAQHKIDVATLDLDPDVERIVHERFPVGHRLSYISKLTLDVVAAFFHVEIVVDRPAVIFAGTQTDITIAHYVFGFLTGTCARELRRFEKSKRRRPSLSRRQNFIAGFIYGVRHQLRGAKQDLELADSTTALAVADGRRRRQEYMAELVPNTKAIAHPDPRRNKSALIVGFDIGRETPIRPAICTVRPGPLLLT